MKRLLALLALSFCLCLSTFAQELQELKQYKWHKIQSSGEQATPRHENNFVQSDGLFYLIGGRGVMSVDVFNPKDNTWTKKANTPIEFNHFQAVELNSLIYIVCAMNGRYPVEKPLENVWVYNPKTDVWTKSHPIPKEHQRGGAGSVAYQGKIYTVAGIELGHTSGTTNIFSCYDPETGQWSTLTKAPHIRDHFSAIVVGEKLYCIGGRNSSEHKGAFKNFFNAVTPEVDIYDFTTKKWTTLVNDLPTPTAAGGIVNLGNYIIYFGGEASAKTAYNQTQCLDLTTGTWCELSAMITGLHGSGAILYDSVVYWAAGSYRQGGSNTNDIYKFQYHK